MHNVQDTSEVRMLLARLLIKAIFACFVVGLLGAFSPVSDVGVLVLGAVTSAVMLGFYTWTVAAIFATGASPSWTKALSTFGALIPFAFSAYLFFYRGLWRLTDLWDQFAWWTLGEAIAFVILGWWLIKTLHMLSELQKLGTNIHSN